MRFARSASLRPIYKRNILLARLSAVFTSSTADGRDAVEGKPNSVRLKELMNYTSDQLSNPACFDDIKPFIEILDSSGLEWLIRELPRYLEAKADDERKQARLTMLTLKLRYFILTFPAARSSGLGDSLASISRAAVTTYREKATGSPDERSGIHSELVVLIALCYIDMANQSATGITSSDSLRYLIKALSVLEEHLSRSPKDSVVSLLLVQLHLRVGSASRARVLWDDLGVKRTIVDSIAPILCDRLSTIAPKLLSASDRRGAELAESVRSHYEVSLKHPMPRRLLGAFEEESYSSILQIPQFVDNLRNSCTRVMSLVEESRTARLLDGAYSGLVHQSRYRKSWPLSSWKDPNIR